MSLSILKDNGASIGASVVDQQVSKLYRPRDRWYANLVIVLTNVSQSTGITFKLKDSFDGGQTWYDVGSESQISLTKKTFVGDTGVDPTNEQITSTAHGFLTADQVIVRANGATLPTGLTDGTTYWVIKVDANTLKLAATQADALAGTAVNITADGSNANCAIYAAVYEIRMLKEDATDLAQLPLKESVAVFANSGASDSATVGAIYFPEE